MRAAAATTVTIGAILIAEGQKEKPHEWIPDREIKKVDEHKVKKELNVPKGHDLAWDEEGNVYVHPKGDKGEVTGPGDDQHVTWDELVRDYPKQRGKPW